MYRPKISIIVPCYGVEKYLDRCLSSIINQTFSDLEIILVDDCSPDNTPQICDEWAKKDSRIKVVHKGKNEGLGFARNTGLKIASGEYVAFVDSDDFVDITMYETLYKATNDGTIDVVYCGLRIERKDGTWQCFHDFDTITLFDSNKAGRVALSFIHQSELTLQQRLFMSVWHGLYKRRLIQELNLQFYSEREILSEDLPFQIEFCMNASLIKFIPDYLYTYCFNETSLTKTFKLSKFSAAFKLRNLLLMLAPHYPDTVFFIDAEFYGRIRYLIRDLIFSTNHSLDEKIGIIRKLCTDKIWDGLNIQPLYKECTWKYIGQYELLRKNKPRLLFLFSYFDTKLNRNSLKFWK